MPPPKTQYIIGLTIHRFYGKSFPSVYHEPDGSVKLFTKAEGLAFIDHLSKDTQLSDLKLIAYKGAK